LTNWKVPLADLDLGEEEIAAVTDVLRSRWLSMGPVTAEFERRFAEYVGVTYAFAVTNCTAALHLAHLALGAGPGDTIICPSLTFVATANAIRYTGATPAFADITSEDDLNISPDDIEAKIDETTKGLCVVHYGGYPCDMDRIMRIARQHNLYVVEDVAHAPGVACWVDEHTFTPSAASPAPQQVLKKCGSIGDIGCFSFFSNKNMTTAEGGMITTNNAALADKIRVLRSHGMTSLTWDRDKGHSFSYDVVAPGYNYRIDEIRSSLGLVQLKKLNGNNGKRAEAVNIYREKLGDMSEIHIPFCRGRQDSSYHLFPMLLEKGRDRTNFMGFMKAKGIQTSIHYPPIHKFTEYRALGNNSSLPLTDNIESRIVTLPLYPNIHRQQIHYTIESILEWLTAQKSATGKVGG
jgi:dTDP-4-amino-4,6-dideoxygalactose transaminase